MSELNQRAMAEMLLITVSGHSERAMEPFTKERVFWLMDERSEWLMPGGNDDGQ